jgi:ATP-binding cassette subfamily C protein CydD
MPPPTCQTIGFKSLVFDRVEYTYPEGKADLRPTLHDVSFEIRAGQRIAMVGPSGAGKSTAMALLLRFIEPTRGQILVDGQSLQAIDPADWRRQIAWVPQRPYLFNDTLEANIRLGYPEASREELQAAICLAHLDEVIRILPGGCQTLVGERGAALSGGQIQRVALARAFLKNAPFLLLDEPVANLDPEQEAFFQTAIEQLGAGKTVFSIAHRLSTARNADRILVISGGRLVESGQHADLLELRGLYHQMVNVYVAG